MSTIAVRAGDRSGRYLVALFLSATVVIAQVRLGSVFGETALFVALPAVVAAAWFGGVGPGMVAALVPSAISAWFIAAHHAPDARLWSAAGVELFGLTALLICITLDKLRRCVRDERGRRMDIERLLRRKTTFESLSAALSVARTSADVAAVCASELKEATGASSAAAALVHADDAEHVEIVHSSGYEESIIGRAHLWSRSAIGTSLQTCELVTVLRGDGGVQDLPFDIEPFLREHAALIIVPLGVSRPAFAAVTLGFNRPRVFEEEERAFLREAGHRTAYALARARLYDSAERARVDGDAFRARADTELRERRRAEEAHQESEARYRALAARTHRLYSLNAALSEAVTLDAVAKAVVHHGRAVVGAAAGSVALYTDGDAFETLYAEDYPPPVVEAWHRFPAEPGLCTTAAVASRNPVLVGSFAEWQSQYPRSAATAADGGFTSVASLPLLVDNVPIGVLSFHFTVPLNFDHEYQALLTSVAHHAAQAIDRARLYEATQRARVDAEAANRAKDDFLSIVSHELRTPLNAILGWGVMLRDGSLDGPHQQRATEAIVNSATRQARLIDDLLEVSRIVAGRVSLNLQELDLADIVQGAAEAMLPAAAEREIELHIEALPCVGVIADPHRLEQVFVNLLANAVKFTPAGGRVTIDGAVDGGMAHVRVVDTGCGIDSEVLPHIFERFRQGHNPTTARSVGGLGLGLFIVRRLLEAQHGQIVAESGGTGTGATFTVTLPVCAAPVAECVAPRPAGANAHSRASVSRILSELRVLIVDDDVDAREMMSSALEMSGATVITASSVREGLAILPSDIPIDVVLADLAMPDEDGYALIRHIRTAPDPRIARIPAAAVTACARADERQRALAAGFCLHLPKPIAPTALVDAVARLARVIIAGA